MLGCINVPSHTHIHTHKHTHTHERGREREERERGKRKIEKRESDRQREREKRERHRESERTRERERELQCGAGSDECGRWFSLPLKVTLAPFSSRHTATGITLGPNVTSCFPPTTQSSRPPDSREKSLNLCKSFMCVYAIRSFRFR